MKKILSIIIVLALVASGFIYFTKESEDSTRVLRTLPVTKAAETDTAADAIPVKIMSVQKNQISYLNVSGSVKSEEQIKVFASAIGQITSVKVVEGQEVKKGQILFQIGGLNNTKHSLYNQLEMATNNLNVAKEGYNKTIAGNAVALNAANLQLKSAINQLNGTKTDLETIDNNLSYGQENLDLLEDAYDLTVEKNENSLNQIDDLINNLVTAQDELIAKKQQLQQQLNSINTGTLDQATKDKMTAEIKSGITALEKSIKELDTQIETAGNTSDTTESINAITEKQLQIQLNQSASALEALELSKQSATEKLGLFGGTSDPVRLAQQNVAGVKVKNEAGLLQAKSQMDLAKINLELLQSQIQGLAVKAPIDGVVGDITAHAGDLASTQAPLTQIIGSGSYELAIGVDTDTAQKISSDTQAEVKIDGKFIKVPIKNVASVADPISKLITVTLALPNINPSFKVNQNLSARIIIVNKSANPNAFYIPLDSVIIGTEEQYVYILVDGKAQKRVVKIGKITDENIEITQGLKEDDQVIIENAKILIDGQSVNNTTTIPR